MNKPIDKKLLKNRFKKSLKTYDENAFVQAQISKKLLLELNETKQNRFNKILEIGCGTGLLTKEILNNIVFEEFFINDLVKESVNNLAALSEKIKKVYGDCEKISLPSDLDLVISSSTFQWLSDFDLISEKINTCLKEGGIFAFTTFGKKNLCQIKEITGKSLNYCEERTIRTILEKNFEILYFHSEIINLEFSSANEILKHLKLSGVNAIEKTNWTKKDLAEFSKKYNALFKASDGKLTLTYEPLFFIAKRK